MTDDFASALAEAIHATGIDRYRWLTSDANPHPSPNSRDDWRRFILDRRWEAQAMPAEARPSVAESLAMTRKMGACPFRSKGVGCGCEARCALRGGKAVAAAECFDCLRRYPT